MTTLDVLRTVAGHGLPGDRPVVDLASPEVGSLLVEASAHKLVGLLDQAVADGAVRCDDADAQQIGERAVEVAAWSVRLERHLLAVHDLLDDASIPHRFVKGATVAHRFYDHPGLRMSVDVDLLVETHQLEPTVERLEAADHVRQQRDPYPGFSRRYAKSVTARSRQGVEVDVHRVIPDGPFGLRAGPEVLWRRPVAHVVIGGRAMPTLDPAAAFVQACVNAVASFDMVSLASLRDVAQIGPAIGDDLTAVQELARAMAVEACVAEAVMRASTELQWTPSPAITEIAGWPISPREREWLDAYRARPSDLRRTLLGLRAVPTAAGKASYLVSVAALALGRPSRRRAQWIQPSRRRFWRPS
ncbi:MAG: nucleotidyltransferase family protein [Acidimicrobiales bacterium]